MKPFSALCVGVSCLFACLPGTAKEPLKPNLGPDLPTITVICGEVTLLLRQSSQWTPGRIDYRGSAMTTERSAYGTVFSFPNVGFIGTAHLENEPEKLQSIEFFVDGGRIEKPTKELKGDSFRFERKSRIRAFDLTNIIEVKDNQVHETSTVHTDEAVPLKVVYHFMHAWVPGVSAFLTENETGPLLDEAEVARRFYINKRVDWMAVYEPKSSHFGVSCLLQAPEPGEHISMIWNVPGTYRKFYLRCFSNATVPAGFTGTWRMTTAFGSGRPHTWEASARQLAQDILKLRKLL